MKHLRKRLLAVFLAAVMLVTSVGTSSYAYEAEKKGNLSVTGNDGKTIEEEESWEEKFPNGTFAFKNDSITIEEGKNVKEQKITIYRLGGTKGKATAKVAITPAVAALDEDEKELVYANAASNKDYTVKVENPIGTDGTMGKQQVSSSYEVVAKNAALVIRGMHLKSSGFIIFVFILPMWMNFLLRTIAWQSLLEKTGVINMILQSIGLPKQNLINTEGAIILGMIYNFLPFMVLPIYNSLIKIPQDTFDAAKDLGANWIQSLWRITLPQILPGIVSGITMVFVPAMTTFVISNLLGGAKINLIGNVIEQEFTTANNWYGGAGLSIVLMILILGSMAVMSHFDKEGEGAAIW